MKPLLERTAINEPFKKYVRNLIEPMFNSVSSNSSNPDSFENTKKQVTIYSAACNYGVEECMEQASVMFRNWFMQRNPDENNPINKELRNVVYCNGIKNGMEKHWEFLWQRYLNSNVASEQQTILRALGCINDVPMLQRYLNYSLDSTKIRRQDSTTVYAFVAHNEKGYDIAKNMLLNNFEAIKNYHAQKPRSLGSYLKVVAGKITTQEELKEFQTFASKNADALKTNKLSLQQALEMANNNVLWSTRNFKSVSRILAPRSLAL